MINNCEVPVKYVKTRGRIIEMWLNKAKPIRHFSTSWMAPSGNFGYFTHKWRGYIIYEFGVLFA
jgi:hypothetical protein